MALLEHCDELFWRENVAVPQTAVVEVRHLLTGQWIHCALNRVSLFHVHEVNDVELAVKNHLVCDFLEETGHPFVSVIIARNCVDHLDRVHQGWKLILDIGGCPEVERFDELFKGLQIFDIVFGLTKCFCHLEFDASPL